jgi:plastocyanin
VHRHSRRLQHPNGSAYGDAVWVFSFKRAIRRLVASASAAECCGSMGLIAEGADSIKIGDNNMEYRYFASRTRVKAGTSVTFTNVGDIPHTATDIKDAKWDTGAISQGRIEHDRPQRGGHLLLHLYATPVDVRADHRRVGSRRPVNGRGIAPGVFRGVGRPPPVAVLRILVAPRTELCPGCRF